MPFRINTCGIPKNRPIMTVMLLHFPTGTTVAIIPLLPKSG
jgi:hypothetical protein